MSNTPASTTVTTSTGPTAKRSSGKQGNNRQPKRQIYSASPSRTIKRWTEALKSLHRVSGLTPEQRGAIAFFTLSSDRSAN